MVFDSYLKTNLMKPSVIILLFVFLTSCIPVKIAPTIEGDKIMVAKKFKRKLPKQYSLIFEDPKEANEFYNFINTKYQLDHVNVENNVAFKIENQPFYFSFYETNKDTKTINLVPILVDAKRDANGTDPLFSDMHTSRKGKWYLVLIATDYDSNDCLNPKHTDSKIVEKYLRDLKVEYLNTSNYIESMLRNN